MHEVGVVGLGSMGSMALWQLARRGVSAIGFEQFSPGHDRGAHSGETRLFRTAYLEGQDYVPLLQDACRRWRDLEADTGAKILSLDGCVSIGASDHPSMSMIGGCVERFGLSAEIMSREVANERYPALNVLPGEQAVLDRAGGMLAPELAVLSATARAEALGATVMRRAEVRAIEADQRGVWIRTAAGDTRVRRVIVAAGAWSDRFLAPLGLGGAVKPHMIALMWFACRRPELFAKTVFPAMMRFTHGTGFAIFPSQDGRTIKAGTSVEAMPIDYPDRVEPRAPAHLVARSAGMIAELYPDIYPDPIRACCYTDGYTADMNPLVGPLPDNPNVVVAAGFSGHGFKMAPTIGTILADYAAAGETTLPAAFLAPAARAA